MTGIEKAIKILGASNLANHLGVSEPMISKAKKQKYAPANWYQTIVTLCKGQISYDDLYADLNSNIGNSKPQVKSEQPIIADSACSECRQRVRKHRHTELAPAKGEG